MKLRISTGSSPASTGSADEAPGREPPRRVEAARPCPPRRAVGSRARAGPELATHNRKVHLAQLNVGRLRAPLDDPRIDDFRSNLDRINALAEASPGFVWRLQDSSGDATGIRVSDDELEIINLTVWESIGVLAEFTYRTAHAEFLRRRREFFEPPTQPILCLWWIPEGTFPTVEGALARLEHLRAHGPTPTAFTFRHRFERDDVVARPGSERDVCPA